MPGTAATILAGVSVVLLGWLAGIAANYAADLLPIVGRGGKTTDGDGAAPAKAHQATGIWHYATLPWYLPRRGICPHCGAHRPIRAPLLEATTAATFLVGWLKDGVEPVALVIFWLYAAFFLIVLVIDLEHRRVLNVMVGPAAGVALVLAALHGVPTLLSALMGGAVGFGLFFLVALIGRGKMGAGDVKLAGMIGVATGYPAILAGLFIGIVLGGVAGLVLVITRRAGMKSYIAYAPYLSLGALFVLFRTLH